MKKKLRTIYHKLALYFLGKAFKGGKLFPDDLPKLQEPKQRFGTGNIKSDHIQ